MTITMGHLVSTLFARYERELRDPELAALATQLKLTELLEGRGRRSRKS